MRKVAYILSLKDSLESFIYREVECLQSRGLDVVGFAFYKDKGGSFSPSKLINVYSPSALLILSAIFFLVLMKPKKTIMLLIHALKYGSIIELALACFFSRKIKLLNITHIQCHFGDRKFFVGYYCKQITEVELSLTVHAHEIYANPNEKLFRDVVHKADKIISISNKNKEILVKQFDVNPSLIEVIRLSIDLSNFKKENSCYVLTVARYTERKGFDELFQAIARLSNISCLHFITVGWGDLNLQSMAKMYGIENKVTIFNKMDQQQLKYFYNNCQIFCLPSKTTENEGEEGIPVVLMEAMASEMIVVTTSNGSINELVDDILVEEGDVDSLVEGLRCALNKVQNGCYPFEKSREKVTQFYSDENIDNLMEYLYG